MRQDTKVDAEEAEAGDEMGVSARRLRDKGEGEHSEWRQYNHGEETERKRNVTLRDLKI